MAGKRKRDFDAARAGEMTAREIGAYLNERERRFAEEYLKDLNGTQAAIRAGYAAGRENASAAVSASRLLRDEAVKAYRAALVRESVEDLGVGRETIVLKLIEIYQRCAAAEPVLIWDSEAREWRESGTWKFDAKGALRALETLMRLLPEAEDDDDAGGLEQMLFGGTQEL